MFLKSWIGRKISLVKKISLLKIRMNFEYVAILLSYFAFHCWENLIFQFQMLFF